MAQKCISCNKTKGKRYCPALNGGICAVCCATKRLKEIDCPKDCEHLEGVQFQIVRDMIRTLNEDRQTYCSDERTDILKKREVVLELVEPMERFLDSRFYQDRSVNDDDIYDIFGRAYMFYTQKAAELRVDYPYEQEIIDKINEIFSKSSIAMEMKCLSILRIIHSNRMISGGRFGNRNFLKVIHEQFLYVDFG